MTECVRKYNIRAFNFADEFFTANKERVLKICDCILSRNLKISWVCSARAQGLDIEVLRIMKRAGCREISFGIESGNQEILNRMHKEMDLDEAHRVIKSAKKAGLATHAGYIIGYLGETEDTIKDTVRIAKTFNTDIAAFFIASPLPGTELYRDALEMGCIRGDAHWRDYSPISNNRSVLIVPGLTIERIRYLHRKAIKDYYLRFKYIFSQLCKIRDLYKVKNLLGGFKIFLRVK